MRVDTDYLVLILHRHNQTYVLFLHLQFWVSFLFYPFHQPKNQKQVYRFGGSTKQLVQKAQQIASNLLKKLF